MPVTEQVGPLRVTVAAAAAGDCGALATLEDAARQEVANQRGGAMLLAIHWPEALGHAGFGRLLDGGAARVWLGAVDGAPLGFALARPLALADGRSLAVVDALYVLPEARGVGLGEALMDEVLAWAAATGAAGVDALALPGDRVTKNFFERYGMTARALQVHRAVEPPPAGGET
ncbi:MAG: GNAT family N-acetyltransferase [Acidimicrobiia bacterium]|nr:GNAT family N-acetyltransferase [Acidimicrobiia bacterium]